jgi:dephospho-CoA kinase
MIIGITGPSGAGKSTVTKLLQARGFAKIDVDKLAKNLYLPGKSGYAIIVRLFGNSVLSSRGRIDKKRLAALIFGLPAERKRLNKALRPLLLKELRRGLAECRTEGKSSVALDMAILFSSGAHRLVDRALIVQAPLAKRLARLKARGLEASRALAQAKALVLGPAERGLADAVLENRGSLVELKSRLASLLKEWGHGV